MLAGVGALVIIGWNDRAPRPYEAFFVLFATGFVAHEIDGEVKWLDEVFHAVPRALHGLFPSTTSNS